jgi:site-specific DNA recombinase
VAGGRCFGYDNVRQSEGYVLRVINEREAGVVREIFILYASGRGLRSIVYELNDCGAPAPRPRRKDRPRGWSMSSIYAILRREIYVGRVVWNKSAKRDRWGQKRATKRPATDWISYDAPELQIVSGELWQRVQHRLRQVRRNYTRHTPAKHLGQPSAPVETTHALLGFAACGACGGAIIVHGRSHGHGARRVRKHFYACSTRWNRGTAICGNSIVVPAVIAEDAILRALEDQFLQPAIVSGAIAQLRAEWARPARPSAVVRDLARVTAQIERIVDAVQGSRGEVAALVDRLRRLEARQGELRAERDRLRTTAAAPAGRHDLEALEADILRCIADRQTMYRAQPVKVRPLLADVLVKRMTWTPQPDDRGGAYAFTAECSFAGLISGLLPGGDPGRHPKRLNPLGATIPSPLAPFPGDPRRVDRHRS